MGKKFILVILLAAFALVVGIFFWSEPELPPRAKQKRVSENESVESVPAPKTKNVQDTARVVEPEVEVGSEKEQKSKEEQPDSLLTDSVKPEIPEIDTGRLDTNLTYEPLNPDLPDSVVASPGMETGENRDNPSEVDQTELVTRVRMKAVKLDAKSEGVTDSATLSLLEKQSEINVSGEKYYTVEFWQTPFNTAGYKMGNLKLLMYGVDYDRTAEMYEFQDTFYLRNFNNFYQLRPLFNMQPLKQVDSTHVLFEQLKNNE